MKFCAMQKVDAKLNELVRQGWEVKRTAKNHLKVVSPEGKLVVVAFNSSDRRAELNALARLCRAGG